MPSSTSHHALRHRRRIAAGVFALLTAVSACGDSTGPSATAVASVVITPATHTLVSIGETIQLEGRAFDAKGAAIEGTTLSWTTSNSAAVTVGASGLATAIGNGAATITASAQGVSGTATVTVATAPPVVAGAWAGFTGQNNTISFRVTEQRRIEGLSVPIAATVAGSTCTGAFKADTAGQPITAGGFLDSVSNSLITLSSKVAVSGSVSSPHAIAGTVAGYSGSFAIICGSTLSIGTGTLWGNIPYEARPLIPTGTDVEFTTISSGATHTCALTSSGAAYCWGNNGSGRLGDGTTTNRNVPTPVVGGLTFASINAGFAHTCGVTTDDDAYCWGNNANGRLGDGTTTNRSVPTPVAGGLKFASIRAPAHTCGLTPGGIAYCWGNNFNGQVGDGTNTHRSEPVPVAGGLTFTSLGGSASSTCGITTAGSTYCWGANSAGELGDGTTAHRNQPVALLGGLSLKFIGTGRSGHSCGITVGDDLYCWGGNNVGQIGDGTTENRTQPVQIAAGSKFSFVSTASADGPSVTRHTCAVTTDGQPYCWGSDDFGKLGRGEVAGTSLKPSLVFGDVVFASVSAGGDHTCGISRQRVTYCWGRNAAGQTGLGRSSGGAQVPMPIAPRYP